MIQKERIVPTRANQDIEKLINRLTQGKPYDIRNWDELRNFDAKNGALDELANIVCTLISDLKDKGIIKK